MAQAEEVIIEWLNNHGPSGSLGPVAYALLRLKQTKETPTSAALLGWLNE